MTVAVGHHPATMPSYNSVDLDEVHSLSRYCFLYSSSWEACVVFSSCCAPIMYFPFSISCSRTHHGQVSFPGSKDLLNSRDFSTNIPPGHFHGSHVLAGHDKTKKLHQSRLCAAGEYCPLFEIERQQIPKDAWLFFFLWISLLSGP